MFCLNICFSAYTKTAFAYWPKLERNQNGCRGKTGCKGYDFQGCLEGSDQTKTVY